jgi:hypothetical protein
MTVATAMRMIFQIMAFMQFLTVWAIVVTSAQSREMFFVGKHWATTRDQLSKSCVRLLWAAVSNPIMQTCSH